MGHAQEILEGDEDIADIAAYFASLPMMKGSDFSTNPAGMNLFENGDSFRMIIACKNCHGITGKGKEPHNPTFPVIGGQRKEYLLKQLASF